MTWAIRQNSKTKIDAAGRILVDLNAPAGARDAALQIVNNWRSCHAFPLNTIQIGLRKSARRLDADAIVAQRIKRLSSIELKLRRYPTMTLSQMQDLGGCRAIVNTVGNALALADRLRRSKMKHKLHPFDNYINSPQPSGYRGLHLIYRYYSDRSETYNGQKVEVQIRSALQHAWATAVETVGTFTRHALKSSIGPDKWLRFFALMGSVIAVREQSNLVPNTPADRAALLAELRALADELDVVNSLLTYGAALTQFSSPASAGSHYFLIELDTAALRTLVKGFKSKDLALANQEYLRLENQPDESDTRDAVLVSVENVNLLKTAYPNYFLDTTKFVDVVREALASPGLRAYKKRRSARG